MGLKNKIKSFFLSNNAVQTSLGTSTDPFAGLSDFELPAITSWLEENTELYSQLEDKYYQYFIGVNSLMDLSLNSFEIEVIRSLEKTLKLQHSLADEIPRLPDIVPKLIHLLRTDDFSWKDVADLIAMDPVILVGIIKVANSSVYNLHIKDEKLENILAKIGIKEVREVIMKVALKPIMLFKGGHFLNHSGTKIWIHAVKSASASRTLAELYNKDPFDAYLAGLLNNLGMAIVVKKMNEIKEFKSAPHSLQFKNELLKFSKQLSVRIAENWDVCSSVQQALAEQMHSDAKKIKSSLGPILYEATAVSMKHILVGENRWKEKEPIIKNSEETPFETAYKRLDAFNIG